MRLARAAIDNGARHTALAERGQDFDRVLDVPNVLNGHHSMWTPQ